MSDRQLKILALTAGVTVITAAYVVHRWWNNRLPSKWRKVGVLDDLMCFPIKSCAGIKLQTAECEVLGLRNGILRDRVFMITTNNKFITARIHPELVKISTKVEDDELILEAPGMEKAIKINIRELRLLPRKKAKVWEHTVTVIDCGDEVADWLSRYMKNGSEEKPRLVYYPLNEATHDVNTGDKIFKKLQRRDVGAFSDATSFHVIVAESVEDLNTRLSEPVSHVLFRPNFLVRGPKAYEEDTWDYVHIGDAVFRNVMPCTRCLMTTVNPETGIRDDEMKALKTLKTYRQVTDPKVRRFTGDKPVMGMHLVICTPGTVRLGDDVYVSEP